MARNIRPWYTQHPAIFRYKLFDILDGDDIDTATKIAAISLISDYTYEDATEFVEIALLLERSMPDIFSIIDLIPTYRRYMRTLRNQPIASEPQFRHPTRYADSFIFDVFHYLCRTTYVHAVRVPCLDMDEFRERMIPRDRIAVRVCDDDVITVHCKNQTDAVMVRLHWQLPAGSTLPEV